MSAGDRVDWHCERLPPRDRPPGRERSRARAHGTLLAGLLLPALVAVFVALLLGGCGDDAAERPAQPFGAPPAAAPGVRAWAAGEVGDLLVTADGGASWRRQRFYLSERGVDVAFPDARDGWLVTDAGTVLATVDGGAHWTVVKKDRLELKAVAASDAGHAWAVGTAVDAAGEPGTSLVLSTTDGGAAWTRTGFGGAALADIAFADARHGVLVALDRIWSTRDGGRHWKLRRRVAMAVLTSAFAGDARHAWVAGWHTQDGSPFVMATRDGGATWRRLGIDVPAPAPGALQAGRITGAAAAGAWAGARLWITCAAGVLTSPDAGRTWSLQKVAAGLPQAIAAADAQHLVAATSGQAILATTDGGATWRAYGHEGFLRQPLVAVSAVDASASR